MSIVDPIARKAYIAEWKRLARRKRGLQKQGRKPYTEEEKVLADIKNKPLKLERTKRWRDTKRKVDSEWRDKDIANSKAWREANKEKAAASIRNATLKKKYGIDSNIYDQMSLEQNHCCAVCGKPSPLKSRLAVDHNHITGKVRKLLCQPCNTTLGLIKEDISVLESLILYLKAHENST